MESAYFVSVITMTLVINYNLVMALVIKVLINIHVLVISSYHDACHLLSNDHVYLGFYRFAEVVATSVPCRPLNVLHACRNMCLHIDVVLYYSYKDMFSRVAFPQGLNN